MNESVIEVIYVGPIGFVFVPDDAFANKTRNTQHVGYYNYCITTAVIDCNFICLFA